MTISPAMVSSAIERTAELEKGIALRTAGFACVRLKAFAPACSIAAEIAAGEKGLQMRSHYDPYIITVFIYTSPERISDIIG